MHKTLALLFFIPSLAFAQTNPGLTLKGSFTAGDCTEIVNGFQLQDSGAACGGGSGSGTVNNGTQYQMGYYATTGTAISGQSRITTDVSNDFTIATANTASSGSPQIISPISAINGAWWTGSASSVGYTQMTYTPSSSGTNALLNFKMDGDATTNHEARFVGTNTFGDFVNKNDNLGAFEGESNFAAQFGLYNTSGTTSGIIPGNTAEGLFAITRTGVVETIRNSLGALTVRNVLDDASSAANMSLLAAGAYQINTVNALRFPTSDTTAGASIAIGGSTLSGQTSSAAYGNVAVGYDSMGLQTVTTAGIGNVAVGYQSMQNLTSGHNTVAIGWQSIGSSSVNYSGLNNVFIGYQSGYNSQNPQNNVAIGYSAGSTVTSGKSNTIIGASVASTTLTIGSNNILIGTNSGVDVGTPGMSNTLNIGNVIYATGLSTSGTTPEGNVGIGTASPNSLVALDMSATTGAVLLPTGTTGQEPLTPVVGEIRYNSTNNSVESYQGASPSWVSLGAAGGSGTVTSVTFTGDGTILSSTPSSAVTTSGTLTATLATQTANTVLGALTATTPSDLAIPSCSTSSSALQWTSGTGFGCNTAVNAAQLNGATFSAPGAIGGGTASSGTFTSITDTGEVITSTSSGALAVGANGSTNAAFGVNLASSQVNGIFITGSLTTVSPTITNQGSDTSGHGLDITITSRAATAAGNGGGLLFNTGGGFGTSNPSGSVTFTTAAGVGAGNSPGGSYIFNSGNGHTTGAGGSYTITLGNGGPTGVGGSFSATTGNGGSTSGNSGSYSITVGSVTSGTKGTINLSGDVNLSGAVPSVSTCGGGSISTGSTDNRWTVTGITAATACTVTFSQTMPTGTVCVYTSSTGIAIGGTTTTSATTTTMAALTGTLSGICF